MGVQAVNLTPFDSKMAGGDYLGAKQYALSVDNDILWTLQAAAAASAAGEYTESNNLYDLAEQNYINARKSSDAVDNVGVVAQVLVNDNLLSYKGEVHDGIMINAYKALNFMLLNDWDLARVELNRAYDRQRRAADFYSDEILKEQKRAKENGFSLDIDKAMSQIDIGDQNQIKAYADYVIPFVNLLETAYLSYKGDADDMERLDNQRID